MKNVIAILLIAATFSSFALAQLREWEGYLYLTILGGDERPLPNPEELRIYVIPARGLDRLTDSDCRNSTFINSARGNAVVSYVGNGKYDAAFVGPDSLKLRVWGNGQVQTPLCMYHPQYGAKYLGDNLSANTSTIKYFR